MNNKNQIQWSEYWALVTGGSSGIGRECVRLLIEKKHYKVIFTYRSNKEQAQCLIEEVKRTYPDCYLECYPLDLSNESSILELIAIFQAKKYQFNVIIHNAGVGTATVKTQVESSIDPHHAKEHLAFLKINGIGPLQLQEAIDPLLVEKDPGSSILFIGSVGGGERPFLEAAIGDTSSKAYLDFRVKDLAMRNLKTHRHIIRLNPGATDTNMFQKSTLNKMDKQQRADFEKKLPKQKIFSPEKVAEAIIHHIDPHIAQLYHGASISLSGGLHLDYAGL